MAQGILTDTSENPGSLTFNYLRMSRKTYASGQVYHKQVEVDGQGHRAITRKVIYEEREVVEGYVDIRLPKRHKFNNGGFLTVFQDPLLEIVKYGKLGRMEMTLLLYLMGTASQDGSIITDLEMLSDELGYHKSYISRALKGLVERNIVIRKDGNRYDRTPLQLELSLNADQLNYNFAFNGKTATYQRKKGTHPALSMPGEQDGEWFDTATGVLSIESDGRVVQEFYPESEEDE